MPTWDAMDRIEHNPPQPPPAPHRGRGEPPAPGEGPLHPLAPQGTPRAPIRPQTLGPGGCKGHCCPLVAQGWGQRGQPGCDTRSWGRDPSGHPAGRRGRERSRAPPSAVIGGNKAKNGKKESVQHAGRVGRGWRGQPHGKGVKICVPGVCRARALKVLGVLSTPLLPSSIPSHVLLLPGACRPSAKPDPLWEIKGTDPLWEINPLTAEIKGDQRPSTQSAPSSCRSHDRGCLAPGL